jgi:hypothetical protein
VTDAVGMVICHDLTCIVPGGCKGAAFRKGHVIQEEDIPKLLSIGKEHVYAYVPQDGFLHENDAAVRIAAAVSGSGLIMSEPQEGRINFHAAFSGLLHVDAEQLRQVNQLGEIAVATLHTMQTVVKGQGVAGTRIIPLFIDEDKIVRLEAMVGQPFIEILPFRRFRVAMVITGSEVYHGRIQDSFEPVVRKKFALLGSEVVAKKLTDDSIDMIRSAIESFIGLGVDMVVVTGGMSVDPDDRTPAAIRAAGADVVSYGAPMFPGSMFMLAKRKEVPVLGLPGCVMYQKTSIFDLIVPRLLAGVPVNADDIAELGHGGFCFGCLECRYPFCGYGKY